MQSIAHSALSLVSAAKLGALVVVCPLFLLPAAADLVDDLLSCLNCSRCFHTGSLLCISTRLPQSILQTATRMLLREAKIAASHSS